MTDPTPNARRSRGVVIADLLAAAALGWAALVWIVGPLPETHPFGLPITSSAPGRALAIGLLILAIRSLVAGAPARLRAWRAGLGRITDRGEAHLFGRASGSPVFELVAVALGYAALVALATWPHARDLTAVTDLGDPLFSAWRLAWVAHQLPLDVTALFNANIYYPEPLTLTYSDAMLVPALIAAPALWMGVPAIVVTNALFLAAWVASGVATYYLVRALTGRREAAAVAGAVFALYPYRSEHYSHLELQFAMWMPLACWALHRTIASGRLRDGLSTGGLVAAQMLSSLYYGLFLVVYLAPLGLTLWWYGSRSLRPIRSLAAGALLAGVLVAPVALVYIANQSTFGERSSDEIRMYSARLSDYLDPHAWSAVYGRWADGGAPERQLFPGLVAIGLAIAALWPPWSVARLGYALAGLVALDGSLGLHGVIYPLLHDYVAPFRGLRAVSRFSILVGFSIAVLAGFVVARAVERWPRRRVWLVVVVVGLLFADMRPTLTLTPVWTRPPEIYSAMTRSTAVLAEFPGGLDTHGIPFDFYYTYFSTFHWHPTLNGASGFLPASWYQFETRTASFPSEDAMGYLRERGVEYVAVHGGLYPRPEDFRAAQDLLATMPGVTRVASARFARGTSELYRLAPPSTP